MIADLEIATIAAGGDGVARHEGMVVFVPRTAPGDRVRAALRPKGRFARGELREVLEPSPVRVQAPCSHYEEDRCGGCQLQHLSAAAQLEAKGAIVRDAIVRIGRREVDPPDVHPSPINWRYRNKLSLALRRLGPRWIGGLHPYDAPGSTFELADCPITAHQVLEVWRAVLSAASWLPDEPALRGAVRADDAGASFVLEGGDAWPHADRFFAAVPALGSLWWKPEGRMRQLLYARDQDAGAAFAQVNPAMARIVRDHVLDRIAAHAPSSVIDAYAGEGQLARELEQRHVAVTTIELDPDAVTRSRSRLSSAARVIQGRVEDTLADALPADLLVLNPPRTGLDERVPMLVERAASAGGRTPVARPIILYISCNPATLARDVARLPSYRIGSLAAFDMFPQTAHVETVCELLPGAA